MSQSALEIWTVGLLLWSIVLAIFTISFFYWRRRHMRCLAHQAAKLSAYEDSLAGREEDLCLKEKSCIPFYAKVTYTDDDLSSIGNSLKAVTRKKLAQRLGYRILEKYHGDIYETDAYPPKSKAFRLDVLVSIDKNMRKTNSVQDA